MSVFVSGATPPSTLVFIASGAAHRVFPGNAAYVASKHGLAALAAGAFLFLASEKLSGYVTGQILEVNGGQYMP